MSERKYRAQILLELQQHAILAEIAHREGRSISNVVREIVAQYLTSQEQISHEQKIAFARLRKLRKKVLASRKGKPIEDITGLIEESRQERANELLPNQSNDRS